MRLWPRRETDGEDAQLLATVQGFYFLATGVWPLLSRETFERVTGPKTDFWLAQTVGVLVASIGGVLLLGAQRRRLDAELEVLGVASAAGLGLVDVVFALRGRIAKVYLLDAAIEGAIVAGWAHSALRRS
jgi:ABC-type cobalamin transport system permease subunit